jgi:exopolysaccharide biosynthesis polyprenyl glycosylphosphotransferase
LGANGALLAPLERSEPAVATLASPLPERSPARPRAVGRPAKLALDLAAIVLGVLVALRGETHRSPLTAALLTVGYPIVLAALLGRASETWEDGSLLDELRQLVGAASISALVLIGSDAIVGGSADVALGLRIWLCTLALLVTGRVMLRYIRQRLALAGARPTLIVGAGRVGGELARRLLAEPRHGLRPVGFLDYRGGLPALADRPQGVPLLGLPDDIGTVIERTGAECVAFAFPAVSSDERLLPLLEECQSAGVTAFAVPRLFEAVGWRTRVRTVGSLPLAELRSVGPDDLPFAIKHLLDRLIAGLLLVALGLPLLAIATLVKASSPGPVFFRQRRVGRDGREFTMLKFRTMRVQDAALGAFAPARGCAPGGVEGEDRRTRSGGWLRRASLDELPQLINVLRGEMSLIGPRPERPEYVHQFAAELRRYDRRHRVKSGITGLAQVSGLRGQTSIAERAEYDNFYVQNWSFWLDFKIALRTVGTVLALGGE